MFKMFGKLWSSLTVWLDSLERAGNAVNELAKVSEKQAKGLRKQMDKELKHKLRKLDEELASS